MTPAGERGMTPAGARARSLLRHAASLSASKLVRDAGLLFVLHSLGRVVGFLAAAYAMRTIGPHELGRGALALSVALQLAVLGELGFNIAGVRALRLSAPEHRAALVSAGVGLRILAALVLAGLMSAVVLVAVPAADRYIWLLAVVFLCLAVADPQWVFQGLEIVPVFSALQLGQVLVAAVLYVLFIHDGSAAPAYVTIVLAGQAAMVVASYVVLGRTLGLRAPSFQWQSARRLIGRNKYAFVITLSMFVYTGLEIPLISWLLSVRDAGLYRAAQGVVSVIMPLLMAAPLVLYPRLIAWRARPWPDFLRSAKRAAVAVCAIAVCVEAAALLAVPVGFSLLLGPDYRAGVAPCLLLFTAKAIELAGCVPAWGLLAMGADRIRSNLALAAVAVSVGASAVLLPALGLEGAALVVVLRETVIVLVSAALWRSFLRNDAPAAATSLV